MCQVCALISLLEPSMTAWIFFLMNERTVCMLLFSGSFHSFQQFWDKRQRVCVHVFHTGSIEDRRYLRHDILNNDVEFNVIVTTWANAHTHTHLHHILQIYYCCYWETEAVPTRTHLSTKLNECPLFDSFYRYNLAIGNDSDRSLFRKLRLKYAVFDEGHMLKNMNSLRYRHLMAINVSSDIFLFSTTIP